MDHRSKKAVVEGRNREYYHWSMSQENSRSRKPPLSASYFSFESMFLLVCLAASLLLLPLILPPLPPPPLMLLLVPVAILLVLLILAFMPWNVRNFTSSL
ncbi:hypothetical protein ACHQM5_020230 [Ranunculus cassubicifolius]